MLNTLLTKAAEMELTILEDGTISISTGNMAGEHHASADEFIMLVHQLAGGARETSRPVKPLNSNWWRTRRDVRAGRQCIVPSDRRQIP
jgi:hypothetical protein